MESTVQLGELQLAIMQVLWQRGEATAADVHAALAERGLALTTIATMLTKMEHKGVVGHRAEGRRYIYTPRVSQDQVKRSMVGELKERLFRGDVTALVSHLLDEHQVSATELGRLKALIAAHETQRPRKTTKKEES
jgi:predicted transcriptional regulator